MTPGIVRTLSALNEPGRAPKTGACATTAVCRLGRCTSRPNIALPLTLSAESSRRVGLPITLKSFAGFNSTFSGTGSFAAASQSWPYESFLPPGPSTKPFSARTSVSFTFHWSAAACMSIVRACAPTVRSWSHEFQTLEDPPVICTPNIVCA